jgi:mannose/cellobiose epimerase-like protein (N-acyl-D-glucosamine 2-epimerase family)
VHTIFTPSEPSGAAGIDFDEVRTWVFQSALPFWAEHGIDRRHGGFLEEVSFEGRPTACEFKRVRVICRQIYVFSHAALMGWPRGAALSARGCDYLIEHAKLGEGAWARRLSRAGAVIDPTPDLYDLSFVLYAMAWRFRLTGDPEARRCAEDTLAFIQSNLRAPRGGFWPWLPAQGLLLQNPHMHFTEACIAAFEATQDQRFLDQAGELVDLFRARLFDGRNLGERFDATWGRIPSDEALGLEPGHHFEWAWILGQYQRLTGDTLAGEAAALADFAERLGVDPKSGAVFDALHDNCSPMRQSSRAWPNTERIKAWLALFELGGRDPCDPVRSSLRLLFDRYFAAPAAGAWIDQFDGNGAPLARVVPASILYHLFLAFAELLRLQPKLAALNRPVQPPR